MNHYADVILPVPLQGLFTYAIPEGVAVAVGVRVVVSFGRSKTYVGLVARLHDNKPQGYDVKPIQQVMDSEPIVIDIQLKLWQWIADYYMSPIGEVYKAALPGGLKAEDGYRPKTETYIRLTEQYRNVTALHIALNVLARAKKQLEAFTSYLELSHWDQTDTHLAVSNWQLAVSSEPKANSQKPTPSLVYITDMKTINPDELPYVLGCDTLVVNALRQKPHHSHQTLDDAVRFARRVGARQTWLIHSSHDIGRHAEINAQLPPDIQMAFDGQVVELGF